MVSRMGELVYEEIQPVEDEVEHRNARIARTCTI